MASEVLKAMELGWVPVPRYPDPDAPRSEPVGIDWVPVLELSDLKELTREQLALLLELAWQEKSRGKLRAVHELVEHVKIGAVGRSCDSSPERKTE